MKSLTNKVTSALIISSSVFCISADAAFYDSRKEKFEFFLSPQLTNSKNLQFDNGAEANLNKRSALAFGFGYNVNNHIELSLQFAASNGNYTGTRIIDNDPENPDLPNGPTKFTSNMYTSSINLGFTYNILSGPFTPYLSANIGSTYIDTGVPTGDRVTGCWWDPWWGYICTPVTQTYTSTEVNYGGGAGLRYDFNRKLFMKGGVDINYLELNSSNTPDFITYKFTFGFMF
jgi:hypothetical protein